MGIDTRQVEALLENTLYESADVAASNAPYWLQRSQTVPGASTLAGLAAAMAASPEGAIVAHVARFYEAAFDREPGPLELQYYVAVAEKGLSPQQISQGAIPASAWNDIASFFANSPEFLAQAASGDAIVHFYMNVLDRAPDAIELGFYHDQLKSGFSTADILQEFANSPEGLGKNTPQIMAAMADHGIAVVNGTTPSVLGPLYQTISTGTGASITIPQWVVTLDQSGASPILDVTGPAILTAAGETSLVLAMTGQGTDLASVSLTDAGSAASLHNVTVTGSRPLELSLGSKTYLNGITIDAHAYAGSLTLKLPALSDATIQLGSGANDLAVQGFNLHVSSADSSNGDHIAVTGGGAVVTLADIGGSNSVTILNGGQVTVGDGNDTIVGGIGIKVVAGTGQDSITLDRGADVTVGATSAGPTSILVGESSLVRLAGGNSAPVTVAPGMGSVIEILSPSGTATTTIVLSSATSAGSLSEVDGLPKGSLEQSVSETVLDGVVPGPKDLVRFVAGPAAQDHMVGLVSVTASTEKAALDQAAAMAGNGGATVKGDAYYLWFHYGANLYLYEHIGTGNAHDAMGAQDQIVRLSGVLDVSAISLAGTHLLAL